MVSLYTILLLGSLASLQHVLANTVPSLTQEADCTTIINCKTTSTTTTTSTSTSTSTSKTTTTITPTECPSCTPCPSCATPTSTATETGISPSQTCLATVQDWTSFKLEWTEKSKKPKNPESYVLTPSFDSPTILTITGDQHVYEQFTVYLVNTLLGKTSDIPSSLSLGEDDCGKDANECMKKGWSHGTFKIPEGQQTILISWENSGRRPDVQQTWNHGTGQYRFDKAVPCEQENDEQKNQEKLKAMGK